jgi:GntR family transcriptional regulator
MPRATDRINPAELLQIETNGVPIYVQIRDQMLRLIGTGALTPGAQLPTMREVAVSLRVDLNTVRHAYDELARAGVINVIRARGTYVAERTVRSSAAAKASMVDDLAHRAIELATQAGADPAAVGRRILQILKH